MRKTVTVSLTNSYLKRLENQLFPDEDEPITTERAIRHAVRHYPGLQDEVKTLKAEIYDLRAKLKKIGKSQETIEEACQEIYSAIHEDEEGAEDPI
ncbi:MAG: hypothetical protein OXE42_02950 [Gammaproteobacteria bacterium]|nr:hypothetical protein [Gammaproteobacteria bacterium]